MSVRLLLFLPLLALIFPASGVRGAAPKLVLFVTVDQLRGDMPLRFGDRFGEGGFRLLMEQGSYYTNAHYRHSTTFTAVGHASLFTGGNAATHGIAGNDWYDTARKRDMYCVADERHPVLGNPSAKEGKSPRNLTSTTIGDEMLLASGRLGKVFSVSIKDRGAVIPGGHYGKAFWYDSAAGRFITSTYYHKAYPQWVRAWNEKDHAGAYRERSWTLLQSRERYLYRDADDRPFEQSYKHLGRTFPHVLDAQSDSDYYAALRYTPMGDEVTVDFAKELLRKEDLGQDEHTDLLAVSLSATDYIGHAFGPSSLEAEDNLLRLDRTLTDLFSFVDQMVGLEDTLIVLSSDHGVDETPESRKELTLGHGQMTEDLRDAAAGEVKDDLYDREPCCAAGRHFPGAFIRKLNQMLSEKLGVERDLVSRFWNPSFYLDLDAVSALDLDIELVERALANAVLELPGFALAATRTDLIRGDVPDEPIMNMVERAFHPTRSGNVLVVQNAGWYLYPKPLMFSAMHGSPYAYDRYVPVFFAGPGIEPRWYDRRIGPEDIAPTIARYLGINPPSGATGDVLIEVTGGAGR